VCKFRPNGPKAQFFKFTKLILYFNFFGLKKDQLRRFFKKKFPILDKNIFEAFFEKMIPIFFPKASDTDSV
jgi:hypothetical protein